MLKLNLYKLLQCNLNEFSLKTVQYKDSIELMYVQKQVPYYLRTIDFDTLVQQTE